MKRQQRQPRRTRSARRRLSLSRAVEIVATGKLPRQRRGGKRKLSDLLKLFGA